MALVSFTSDFGLTDHYVGTVKAVLLARCPGLTIVDITHAVAPQQVAQAVFLTAQSWPYFAPGTVHLVVVDPGVGTDRLPIALRNPTGYAVGPDNGVLSAALPAGLRATLDTVRRLALPAGYEARSIDAAWALPGGLSATFHGRDLFAPAAALLAGGGRFEQLGPMLGEMLVLPLPRAAKTAAGVTGGILHVDGFGNLITNIRESDVPNGAKGVRINGRTVPIVATYGAGAGVELVALTGSGGYLEIARVNGSAAAFLNVGVGMAVAIGQG